jgi:hypothetical protein
MSLKWFLLLLTACLMAACRTSKSVSIDQRATSTTSMDNILDRRISTAMSCESLRQDIAYLHIDLTVEDFDPQTGALTRRATGSLQSNHRTSQSDITECAQEDSLHETTHCDHHSEESLHSEERKVSKPPDRLVNLSLLTFCIVFILAARYFRRKK